MLLTIDSAGQVLALFTSEEPEHGVTEVAVAIGVSKSKAHALLASLSSVGLLRRTDRSRYRIGWRVLSLNRVLAETTDFYRQARPVMQTLERKFGEMIQLSVLDDEKVVCIHRLNGTSPVQVDASAIQPRLSPHASAAGKVMLASLPAALRDVAIGRQDLARLTPRTITDPITLDAELDRVRRRGFAIERGETIAEISGVAAPIRTPGPVVLAAISITAPSYRFRAREEIYCRAVVRAAHHISRRLVQPGQSSMRPSSEDHRQPAVAPLEEPVGPDLGWARSRLNRVETREQPAKEGGRL
jgi:IclR family transcriptional regulator, KDG regulon repressor